jgi:hypothetical protein
MARASKQKKYTNARQRAETAAMGMGSTAIRVPEGVRLFKPKAGTTLIDIIPYTAGSGNPFAEEGVFHWERTYYAHRGIGANSDTYVCPRLTSKKPCPICEYRQTLMKAGGADNEALVKDIAPKQRQLFNLINLKDPERGVQLWDISYHLFGKFLDARLRSSDEDEGWDTFFYSEGGMTLRVSFADRTFGAHAYVEAESIDFKPRKADYDDDISEQAAVLDDLLIELGYDDLKKIFLQAPEPKAAKKGAKVDDDDDDDEEDEKPSRSAAKKPSRKPAPVEDDEEEDEEDEDETPAPKKRETRPAKEKPAARFPRDKDPDDDEDLDDEEDEEDEAPAPKKKAKKPAPPEDDDEDLDDEDEEETPAPKKSVKKAAPAEEEDDDWDDFDEDEDEDEDPAPKKKKK